jgi:hypothetical protein
MAPRKAKKEKSKTGMLLLLLVALVGVGGWNYHRNAAKEKSVAPSAYAGVADADLDVLIAAYQSEIAALEAKGGPSRARVRETGNLGDGARELARVQRASRRVRESNYEIYERKGALEALEAEKARRRANGGGNSGWMLILRRAFTF